MSGSMVEVIGSSTTPRMTRRSMALSDIDPKYVSQSGIWEASEVETSRGSIRIQHLTSAALPSTSASCRTSASSTVSSSSLTGASSCSTGGTVTLPRFPKLEECAHFHYDCVELPQLKIQIREDHTKPICMTGDESQDKCTFSLEILAGGQSWVIRRTHANIQMLDSQLHRCVWDRTFSHLDKVHKEESNLQHHHNGCREVVTRYLARLNELPTNKITCGTVLSWFELDNRGRRIVASDDSAINTPAVAAACAVRKYISQASDEISFEVGEMISVIDMPPPEESIWWRGKRGFHVGFFPRDYVEVIGDKIPAGLPVVPSVRKLQRLSVSSTSSTSSGAPEKPVLKKHGKLIAFFRSFILSRPSRRRLKQTGILRERVFSCDLAEHLLNTGNEIPTVLKCCAEFIEKHGIVDGVYRLSGITSNIQKLRNAFDEDKIPNLEGDVAIKQDVHAVSSLLKMYFRELPNPLCTYQLYDKFVAAAKESDQDRLFRMREVVHELPPPHYRTLEYLMKHLSRVAQYCKATGMTPKNMAIVWAPNLIRCKELESGGVAALKGIGVQAVVTEYLIRHADLIFNDKLPANFPTTTIILTQKSQSGSSGERPKSLAISSPIKLVSLEEAQDKMKDDRKYIDVGGGPSSLPPKYHTVIDLPSRRGGSKSRRPGWKNFFSRHRSFSKPSRKTLTPGDITVVTRSMPVAGPQGMQTNWAGRLRPVKSVESLVSSPLSIAGNRTTEIMLIEHGSGDLDSETIMEEKEIPLSRSSPATPGTTDVHIMFHPEPGVSVEPRSLQNPKTHNRSISHDSYFEFGSFRNCGKVFVDETLEEETMSQSSKLSADISSSEIESNVTSPVTSHVSAGRVQSEDTKASKKDQIPETPPPSAASTNIPLSESYQRALSTEALSNLKSPQECFFPSPVKRRDSEVQTSHLKLSDVGVSTEEDRPFRLTVAVDSSTCVDDDLGKYDLDKNSTVNQSSEMSTPEEPFKSDSTDIVYSPLVNEMPSLATQNTELASTEKSVSTSIKKLSVKSNRSTQSSDKVPETVCLFVCPLYEAGVTSDDISNSGGTTNSDKQSTTCGNQASKTQMKFKHYENQEIFHQPSVSSLPVTHNIYENQRHKADDNIREKDTACRSYENHRVYENHPIPRCRSRVGVAPGPETNNNGELPSEGSIHPEVPIPKPKPKAREPLPPTCIDADAVYTNRSDEHYENIGEPEGNIYEDIDNENREGKYSGSSSCRYEVVGDSPPKPAVRRSRPDHYELHQTEGHSDDEYSANYESVKFQKVDDKVIAHHYSAVEETNRDAKSSGGSTPSYSKTEDVVRYLEAQTPMGGDCFEKSHSSTTSGGLTHSETIDEIASPSSDEIHFIDSPLVVENPVYSLEIEGIEASSLPKEVEDDDCDISANESISLNMSEEQTNIPLKGETKRYTNKTKLLGRCNSAPLSDTKHEFVASPVASAEDGQLEDSKTNDNNHSTCPDFKVPLHKRLSEPSLIIFSQSKADNESNAAAWKVADAKRLAHRKQSVKELLSKFEGRDSTPSPPNNSGPGLPKPSSHQTLPLKPANRNTSNEVGNAGFQHHRFSMGDILSETESAACTRDASPSKTSLMTRSDTLPELRCASSKVDGSLKENLNLPNNTRLPDKTAIIPQGHVNMNDDNQNTPPEKVQHILRVAMSSVDMNDPNTRERIEKYKEERRSFLRQKISTEITTCKTQETTSPPKTDTVIVTTRETSNILNTNLIPQETMMITDKITSTSSQSFTNNNRSLAESPRKRAFSEEIPTPFTSGTYHTSKTKTIKTESSQIAQQSSDNAVSPDEINVKEKIAMWTMQKKEMSKSTLTCSEIKGGEKPFTKPILRREVTTSSIEISKCKVNRSDPNGQKKIKDMAAFFESKRF